MKPGPWSFLSRFRRSLAVTALAVTPFVLLRWFKIDYGTRLWASVCAVITLAVLGMVYLLSRRMLSSTVATHRTEPEADAMPLRGRMRGDALFFVVLFATLGLFGALFWSSHRSTRDQALIAAANMSEVLASSLQDTMARAHSDLLVFVPQITIDDLAGRASAERQSDLETRMGAHLRTFPAVLNYLAFDASGQRRVGAGSANPHAAINVSDREWFKQLQDGTQHDVVLSDVVVGRATRKDTMILAVPIRDAEGLFLGAMVAAIDLTEFQNRIDRINVGRNGAVVVRRSDNTRLVLRRPQLTEQINEPARAGGFADLIRPHQPAGVGEFTSTVDGITRLYAFRTLPGYPLSVIVGTSVEDYFAPWRQQTILSAVAAIALLAAMSLMYRRRLVAQRRLEVSEERFAAEATRFKAIITYASDGIHILDEAGVLIDASDSFCQMLGYTRDEAIGMNVSQWDTHFSSDDLKGVVASMLAGDGQKLETNHRRKDGAILVVELTSHPFTLGDQPVLFCSSRDIGDRKVADVKLRDSEERFRSLVEGTADWVWETDAEHRISWVSPSFEANLGPKLASALGTCRWDLAAPGGVAIDAWQAHRTELDAHRPFRDFRYWLVDAVENRRWVSVSGAPRFAENGVFIGYRGIGSDITDKAVTSTRLRLFSKTVEQSPLAVVVTDLNGRIEYANPFLQALSGYTADELIGRDAATLGDGGCQDVQEEMWRTIRTGDTWTGEFLNRKKGGTTYWQASTIFSVTDSDGTPTHYVGIGEDISARKRDQFALTEAHARLSAVLNNTPVGIAIISPDRVLLQMNNAFSAIFGLSRDEVEGQTARVLYRSDDDFETIGARAYPLVSAGGTFNAEVPMVRLDGQPIVVNLAARMIDPKDFAMGVVWAAEDVTERLAAEATLAKANADLKKRTAELSSVNAELEQFAYVASHDLRQPLRMVSSYVSLIDKRLGADIDTDMKDFIGYAKDGAKRMDELILGLLQYSRTGRAKDDWKQVSLGEVIAQSVHDLQITIDEAGATIVIADGLPEVIGDPVDLGRLFQNLIGNAVKYYAPDRPPIVSVSCQDDGDAWRLSVVDNGIGIPADQRERVFGIFQRLVTREQYEGTGIGLAICKKIVEQHGGRIWVEDNPGGGSTFLFTLPKLDTPSTDPQTIDD